MPGQEGESRPVGWWLKEAGRRIARAFPDALAGTGLDRRSWQVLTMVAAFPTPRAQVIARLAPFASSEEVERNYVALLRLSHRLVDALPEPGSR